LSGGNNRLQDFTFAKGNSEDIALEQEISKFTSVEQLREYLEMQLGEEKIMKAYPILKDFVPLLYFNL
jgi:hypothetical protein